MYNLSELNISSTLISNNLATNRGAGICSFNASLNIDECAITENEVVGGQGGAMYFTVGGELEELPEVVISNTVISYNIGSESGASAGAIFLKPEEFPSFYIHIENCIFEGNISKSNTALSITGDLGLKIINCSFLSNEAEQYTAGIAFTSGCSGERISC